MAVINTNHTTKYVFGIPVNVLTIKQALELVVETIEHRRRLLIGVVNASKVVSMWQDQLLRDAVLESDIILADGMGVVWASRLLGQPLPERVAGIDLMMQMLECASERGYRVYCLGAEEEVLQEANERITQTYSNINLVGSHHGYFMPDEEPRVVRRIAAAAPDILFVAMSSPRKELFIANWAGRLKVPVCHGVGGAFDVLAGKTKRAPLIWQTLGLEWLYRTIQEPRRLWRRYLVSNTVFCGMVIREEIIRLCLPKNAHTFLDLSAGNGKRNQQVMEPLHIH